MKRAGLDYHEFAAVQVHENFSDCLAALAGRRILQATTSAQARAPIRRRLCRAMRFYSALKPEACRLRFSMACHRRKAAPADAAGQQKHESFQHCGRDAFRSLAAAGFFRRHIKPLAESTEEFPFLKLR